MNFIQRKLADWLGLSVGRMITAQKVGNGVVTWSGQNKQQQVRDGFAGYDIVYSIVSIITNKAKVAPWYEYQITDKKTYRKYKAIS